MFSNSENCEKEEKEKCLNHDKKHIRHCLQYKVLKKLIFVWQIVEF
jgi:hypothetical protein